MLTAQIQAAQPDLEEREVWRLVSQRASEPRDFRTMIRLCIRLGTFCNEPVCASLRTLDLDVFAVISRPKPFCAFGAWELSKGSVDCHWGEQAAPS